MVPQQCPNHQHSTSQLREGHHCMQGWHRIPTQTRSMSPVMAMDLAQTFQNLKTFCQRQVQPSMQHPPAASSNTLVINPRRTTQAPSLNSKS